MARSRSSFKNSSGSRSIAAPQCIRLCELLLVVNLSIKKFGSAFEAHRESLPMKRVGEWAAKTHGCM